MNFSPFLREFSNANSQSLRTAWQGEMLEQYDIEWQRPDDVEEADDSPRASSAWGKSTP